MSDREARLKKRNKRKALPEVTKTAMRKELARKKRIARAKLDRTFGKNVGRLSGARLKNKYNAIR